MTSSESKVAKIQTHFQALASVATSLNLASDELTKSVSVLDEALKKLNVGLTAWVSFRTRTVREEQYDEDQIGYCKVDGKWGIALRRSWGDYNREDFGEEGPWLFNDAPRELRIMAADTIPDVIEALGKAASETTRKVQEKARVVGELASAIEGIANGPKPKTLSGRAVTLGAGEQTKSTEPVSLGKMTNEGKEGGK
jgi:hypothetical protein